MAAKPRVWIRPRIFIILIIAGLFPLLLGHYLVTRSMQQEYQDIIGMQLSQRASDLQSNLINYLERVRAQAANLTRVPQLQLATQRASQQPVSQQQIQDLENRWPSLEPIGRGPLDTILGSETSRFLRDYNGVTTTFRELFITDRQGRLVAASNKTSNYFQAKEAWWINTFREGEGSSYVSDFVFDESVNVYGLEVAEPIRNVSGEVIGVLKAIVDSHELFGLVEHVKVGLNGSAALMRSDGIVISSSQNTTRYEFPGGFQLGQGGSGWIEAKEIRALPETEQEVILGFPQTHFSEMVPGLDWQVVVQVSSQEIREPFERTSVGFISILIFNIALVLVLALLFTWFLSKPAIETDPHLERL